jgi:hypothetical protein
MTSASFDLTKGQDSRSIQRSVSGPLHICCHLNMWAITVCFLMVFVLWNTPICSLMPGSVFSRDFRCIYIVTFLWA